MRCPIEFRFAEKSLSNALSLFTCFKILLHVPMAVPHFDPMKEFTSLSSSERFVLVGRPALTGPHTRLYTFEHTHNWLLLFPFTRLTRLVTCSIVVTSMWYLFAMSHPRAAIKSSTLPSNSSSPAVLMQVSHQLLLYIKNNETNNVLKKYIFFFIKNIYYLSVQNRIHFFEKCIHIYWQMLHVHVLILNSFAKTILLLKLLIIINYNTNFWIVIFNKIT